jgi:Tfp pilus assembly protein PilX
MNTLPSKFRHDQFKAQAGMVLLLCLIFLTALTLLGLSAAAEAVLQNQLAANLKESERAKQSALTALSWAEDWLLELDGSAPEICKTPCDGLKLHAQGSLPANPEFEDLSWWMDQGYEAGIDPLTGDRISRIAGSSINPPIWMIEVVHETPPTVSGSTDLQVWYRILARGSGYTDSGISVIESIVVRSWVPVDRTDQAGTGTPGACSDFVPSEKCGREIQAHPMA